MFFQLNVVRIFPSPVRVTYSANLTFCDLIIVTVYGVSSCHFLLTSFIHQF